MPFQTSIPFQTSMRELFLKLRPNCQGLRLRACAFCAAAMLFEGATGTTPVQASDAAAGAEFVVDGLALGGLVAPRSAAYREYKCQPSEQFANYIWCQRRRTEIGKFGEFKSVTSILHSYDNAAEYISRYIEPAYFLSGDIECEIDRLSQRFGGEPHVLQMPRKAGSSFGVIAYWGRVTLTPLDSASLAELAEGRSVTKGMLFDFLGNFGESARFGLPIFQLGGGRGYVWGARLDGNGKGALRMTAIDASQFMPPPVAARGRETPPRKRGDRPRRLRHRTRLFRPGRGFS